MTSRDRNVVVGVVMLVLCAAFWFLALSPRRHEAADIHAQVESAQQQRDDAAQQAAAAKLAQRDHVDDQAVIAELGKALPADDDTASLLYQLQDAAGRSHVVLKSIAPTGANGAPAGNAAAAGTAAAPGTTPGPAGVTALPISLAFSGSYRDLQRFIQRVHRFTSFTGGHADITGRLLSINGFKLSTGLGNLRSIDATIDATAYIATPDAAAAGATGTGTAAAGTTASATPPAAGTPPAPAPGTVPAAVTGAGS